MSLDLTLRWGDAGDPARRPTEDHFESGAPLPEGAQVEARAEAELAAPSGEGFQSQRDREQALEAALRQMSGTPLACVHRQLDDIRAALESGDLEPARARTLLGEVDAWVARELARRSARLPAADERVREARSRVDDALHAFQDLAALLRGYLESRNPADLVLSRRLGDLAAGFLLQAREELLQEPAPEAA